LVSTRLDFRTFLPPDETIRENVSEQSTATRDGESPDRPKGRARCAAYRNIVASAAANSGESEVVRL
jgi:hypothetical protein